MALSLLWSKPALYAYAAIAISLALWGLHHHIYMQGYDSAIAEINLKVQAKNEHANEVSQSYEAERGQMVAKLADAQGRLAAISRSHPLTCNIGPDRLRVLNDAIADPSESDGTVSKDTKDKE
jgi:hypothetical protein